MTKKEVLTQAKTQREQEVFDYQINIDNFAMAILLAQEDPELEGFCRQLQELHKTNLLEQKKAKIMLQVIELQLEALDD